LTESQSVATPADSHLVSATVGHVHPILDDEVCLAAKVADDRGQFPVKLLVAYILQKPLHIQVELVQTALNSGANGGSDSGSSEKIAIFQKITRTGYRPLRSRNPTKDLDTTVHKNDGLIEFSHWDVDERSSTNLI
jgi:hypothetical protein